MINLKERLIIDYASLKSVSEILSKGQSELILLFFTTSIIVEFFSEWNFFNVLKRLIICFLIMASFSSLLKNSIDLSFDLSNSIIDKCKTTEFCSHYLAQKRPNGEDSTLISETTNLIKNFSSFWLHALVSLIFKLSFVFTIQIYSLVYALTYIAYPLICSLGILHAPGTKAFVGLFQTLLWLFIAPIMLSVIIVLLAGTTEVGLGPNGEVGLEGLLHLMIISLFSLGSLFFSWVLCQGEGVASFGSKMAQMGTTALSMTGFGAMMTMGRGFGGLTKDVLSSGLRSGKSHLKEKVSTQVGRSVASTNTPMSVADLGYSKNSFLNSPFLNKDSKAFAAMTPKEKFIHSVDSVINARENMAAKQAMIKDFKSVSNWADKRDLVVSNIMPSSKASEYKSLASAAYANPKGTQRTPQFNNQKFKRHLGIKTTPLNNFRFGVGNRYQFSKKSKNNDTLRF